MEHIATALTASCQTQQSPAPSSPTFDILTDEDKAQAIAHAIGEAKADYIRKMVIMGKAEWDINASVKAIDWTTRIDETAVLEFAAIRKQRWMEEVESRKSYLQSESEKQRQVRESCDAAYFYRRMKAYFTHHFGKFIYDESNQHYIKAFCFFMAGDPRFENELGYSFNKGLMVKGTAGLGKTKVVESVAENPLCRIFIYSMLDITEQVRKSGECELDTRRMLMIDDVGSEQEQVNHYGTKINWFKDFIETYYLHNKNYNRLIITTNLGGDEMEAKYGYRVRSRVREMFNIITLDGNDKRK